MELGGEYFKKVWERLSAARSMSKEERERLIDFIAKLLEGSRRAASRERLERWLGEWLAKAPGLKQHRVFHTLVNSLRELAQSEEDAGKREVARRRAAGILLYAVLGDGTVRANEVVLYVGGGEEDEVPAEVKADLYYALLRELGYQPKMYKAGSAVHRLYGEEARKFARDALPYLAALERMLEVVKSDEQIYSKVAKMIEMAKAEKIRARVEDFTTKSKMPKARLVIEAEGAAAEYQIYLHKGSAVELHFGTTNREEVERRAAVLRAVGVKAEVRKIYHKSRSRDVWYIAVTTNALAADSVHEAVRKAVAEFLEKCREAGVLGEDTYSHLAAKFERGVPEWGGVRFSVRLDKDGTVVVEYRPSDSQSFTKAVNFLRELGMLDSCEGEWCFVHFTAREPRGGEKGHVYITADGLRYIGWLASRGDERAQWLRDMLLKEAEVKGVKVREQLERRFSEGEEWGRVKPPVEREVEVEGRKLKVLIEEVEAGVEHGETREHLVVKIRAKVFEEDSEVAVDKEAKFYKSGGRIYGYVNIRDERGRQADYTRAAAVLKALGIEEWSVNRERGKPKQIRLTGGALDTFMSLEPVCRALGMCQKA
ncbi:PaRep2b protein [Pyrobaculum sp. 3827-6]|uniref:PaRep2b protein n=1 Tax=Pyrobaculum sp. 3827-6 TaxID=2983604 RepID=UPI0021DB679C|nr:PaRep2b protein [Pyrobaculum sp. 3827-6]MCU7788600.1 PaRep2b protein [Pyrobaculum sp. 3827-6]